MSAAKRPASPMSAMAVLAQAQRNSSGYGAHEVLVAQMALEIHRAERIDLCRLSQRHGSSA